MTPVGRPLRNPARAGLQFEPARSVMGFCVQPLVARGRHTGGRAGRVPRAEPRPTCISCRRRWLIPTAIRNWTFRSGAHSAPFRNRNGLPASGGAEGDQGLPASGGAEGDQGSATGKQSRETKERWKEKARLVMKFWPPPGNCRCANHAVAFLLDRFAHLPRPHPATADPRRLRLLQGGTSHKVGMAYACRTSGPRDAPPATGPDHTQHGLAACRPSSGRLLGNTPQKKIEAKQPRFASSGRPRLHL